MEFLVYKSGGCLHDNISDEIFDENAFISVESSFQKSWMEAYAWFRKFKVLLNLLFYEINMQGKNLLGGGYNVVAKRVWENHDAIRYDWI